MNMGSKKRAARNFKRKKNVFDHFKFNLLLKVDRGLQKIYWYENQIYKKT